MTGRLPQGLITIANVDPEDNPSEEHGEEQQVHAEQLAQAWRVYSASSNVLHSATGDRLQNLFWRIWSNPYLTAVISSSTVSELVFRFGQGFDQVYEDSPSARLQPPSNPYPSTTSQPAQPATNSPAPHTATRATPQIRLHATNSSENTISTAQTPSPSPSLPQSILKRPIADPGSSSKFVKATPPKGGELSGRLYRQNSASAAENISSASPHDQENRTGSGIKKRLSFAAGTGARTRTRPSQPRRKSSQATSSQASEPVKPPVKPPSGNLRDSRAESSSGPGQALIPTLPTATTSAFALPSASSWQSVDSDPGSQVPTNTLTEPRQSSLFLVDRDFRGKFVDNQIRTGSFTNLAIAAKLRKSGSVVRFADELPAELRKGKEREVLSPLEDERGKRAEPTASIFRERHRRKSSGDSQAVSDEEEELELGELPRTKSQLSLMIQSQRRNSGSYDLSSSSSNKDMSRKDQEKTKDTENKDSGDELLLMGRRDGVTKAGGVTPGRGLERMKEGSENHRYRSPSPEPLFG